MCWLVCVSERERDRERDCEVIEKPSEGHVWIKGEYVLSTVSEYTHT